MKYLMIPLVIILFAIPLLLDRAASRHTSPALSQLTQDEDTEEDTIPHNRVSKAKEGGNLRKATEQGTPATFDSPKETLKAVEPSEASEPESPSTLRDHAKEKPFQRRGHAAKESTVHEDAQRVIRTMTKDAARVHAVKDKSMIIKPSSTEPATYNTHTHEILTENKLELLPCATVKPDKEGQRQIIDSHNEDHKENDEKRSFASLLDNDEDYEFIELEDANAKAR